MSKDDLLTYYFSKFVRSIILDKTAGVHLSVTAVAILKSNNFVGQGIADSVDVKEVQSEAKKLYEKYSEDARKKSEGSLTHGKKRSSEKSDTSAVPNKVRKIDSEQKSDSQAPKGDEKKQPSFESSMLSISKSSLSNPNKGKGTSSTYLKELMSRETKRKVLPATAVAMDKNAKTLAGFNVVSKACNSNDTESTLAGEKGVKAVPKETVSKQTNVAPPTTENTSVSMNATVKHDQPNERNHPVPSTPAVSATLTPPKTPTTAKQPHQPAEETRTTPCTPSRPENTDANALAAITPVSEAGKLMIVNLRLCVLYYLTSV